MTKTDTLKALWLVFDQLAMNPMDDIRVIRAVLADAGMDNLGAALEKEARARYERRRAPNPEDPGIIQDPSGWPTTDQ